MADTFRKIAIVVIFIIITFLITLIITYTTSDMDLSLSKKANVAVVNIDAPIMYGSQGGLFSNNLRDAHTMAQEIKDASADVNIDVILLEVNSPGGTVVASKEIANAVRDSDKHVIALIKEVGASGAYWVSSEADMIVADSMTITGSVGVIASYLDFSGLFDKYGIQYQKLTGGELKDIGTPFRNISEDEKNILQNKIDLIHQEFKDTVKTNRKLTDEQMKAVETGQFFLGIEAIDLGLIDHLGDKQFVEDYIRNQYNVTNIQYFSFEKQVALVDAFFGNVRAGFYNVGAGIADSFKAESSIRLQ